MSCSSSSNIRSSLVTTVITQEGDGNRVAFKLYEPGDGQFCAGITGGSVIRWDVDAGWTLSSAHDPASAEVVGVVESIQFPTGATLYTVVASGLISNPVIDDVINRYDGINLTCTIEDSGIDGGEGKNDVLFLSDGCPGALQYLEPIIPGHIVKPVMQRVSAGKGLYNGIVLNYIGYEVANIGTTELAASSPPGDIKKIPENLIPSDGEIEGFVNVTSEQLVKKSDLPELFDVFDVDKGPYEETIELAETVSSLSLYLNSKVTQTNSYGNVLSSGKIIAVNTQNNSITISKDFGQPKTDSTKKLKLGTLPVSIKSSQVSSFTLPSIPIEKTRYVTKNSVEEVTLIPFMRTTKEITSVNVPKTISVTTLESDSIIANGVDVNATLVNLESRLNSLEKRLG